MRVILLTFLCFLLLGSQATDGVRPHKAKKAPEHVGIDPEFMPIMRLYKDFAEDRHIKFTNPVTIGFSNIRRGNVVGVCTYGKNFREIDIDRKFWKRSSKIARKTLLLHEITHCFCARGHDYAEGKVYVDPEEDLFDFSHVPFFQKRPGFFLDGCPISIMYPYIVDDQCVRDHSKEYSNEIFERCRPY